MTDPEPIKFPGILANANIDEDGEWIIRIKVPKMAGAQVAAMAVFIGEVAFQFSALPINKISKKL